MPNNIKKTIVITLTVIGTIAVLVIFYNLIPQLISNHYEKKYGNNDQVAVPDSGNYAPKYK